MPASHFISESVGVRSLGHEAKVAEVNNPLKLHTDNTDKIKRISVVCEVIWLVQLVLQCMFFVSMPLSCSPEAYLGLLTYLVPSQEVTY